MIHVIATLSTAPGRREQLLAAFKQLAPKVHAEKGCIEYRPAVDIATNIGAQEPLRDDVVMVIEKWESVAALEAHLGAPHMEEFRSSMGDVITKISLQVLEPAE